MNLKRQDMTSKEMFEDFQCSKFYIEIRQEEELLLEQLEESLHGLRWASHDRINSATTRSYLSQGTIFLYCDNNSVYYARRHQLEDRDIVPLHEYLFSNNISYENIEENEILAMFGE